MDDEPQIRTLLRNCFQSEGFRISEAASGQELFSLLRTGKVDLITLDLTLGNESGLEIAKKLRGKRSSSTLLIQA